MGLIWGCAPGLALTLLFCLQDTGGNLSFNTLWAANLLPLHPRNSWAANCPSLLLGSVLALPLFTYLLTVLAGKATGRKYKVNCESNAAAPRAQHSNQAIKQ